MAKARALANEMQFYKCIFFFLNLLKSLSHHKMFVYSGGRTLQKVEQNLFLLPSRIDLTKASNQWVISNYNYYQTKQKQAGDLNKA